MINGNGTRMGLFVCFSVVDIHSMVLSFVWFGLQIALSTNGRVLGLILFDCDLLFSYRSKSRLKMLFGHEKYAIENVSL